MKHFGNLKSLLAIACVAALCSFKSEVNAGMFVAIYYWWVLSASTLKNDKGQEVARHVPEGDTSS